MPLQLLRISALCALTLALAAPVAAQGGTRGIRASVDTAGGVAKARAELATKVDEYKESLKALLALLEPEIDRKTAELEKRKELYAAGIASRREVEQVELEIAEKRARIAETRKQFDEADDILEEIAAYDQLARIPHAGGYVATNAIIRNNGSAWNISDIVKVGGYFTSHFGHALPITAYGQTSLHNKLGFDHSNSVDVGVHPDSAEGQALIAYLRSAGVPFLAFRTAIPGKATGPHIHIGFPSHKLWR